MTEPEPEPKRIPLADVADMALSELFSDDMNGELASSVEAILEQVAKPRANLGGAGPPGRAD